MTTSKHNLSDLEAIAGLSPTAVTNEHLHRPDEQLKPPPVLSQSTTITSHKADVVSQATSIISILAYVVSTVGIISTTWLASQLMVKNAETMREVSSQVEAVKASLDDLQAKNQLRHESMMNALSAAKEDVVLRINQIHKPDPQ